MKAPEDSRLLRFAWHWASPFVDPVRLWQGLTRFPGYLAQLLRYRGMEGAERVLLRDTHPCLHDRTSRTPYDRHYFHQNVWAFRRIAAERPERHVDVGSKVDFVAYLTALTKVVFVDLRPLEAAVEGLETREGSILALPFADGSVSSLSCLHVAEHIGLGRYGDPLDPGGTRKAARELERVLAPGGSLYFSVPVGRPRVCFNAHRVHAVGQVLGCFPGLELLELSGIDDRRNYLERCAPETLDACDYGCGLFRFRKPR